MKEEFKTVVTRVLLNMIGTKIWGLIPEKGYERPIAIQHNGEWYIKVAEDKEYFQKPYFDYGEDIKNGIYVPTGIRVGEEENL